MKYFFSCVHRSALQILPSLRPLQVRVSALKCVASILPLLDETTVVHAVLPTLRKVRDADHTPAVVMCSLGCYELIAKRLLPSALARHLLPG